MSPLRLSDALSLCAHLNALGARRGAAQVAFNAACMGHRARSGLVPAPDCLPANDDHSPAPPEHA